MMAFEFEESGAVVSELVLVLLLLLRFKTAARCWFSDWYCCRERKKRVNLGVMWTQYWTLIRARKERLY